MTVFIDSHSILDVTDQLKYHIVFGNLYGDVGQKYVCR